MRNCKSIATIAMCAHLLALVVHADTWTDDAGYTWSYYNISDGVATITSVSPAQGDIAIPSAIGGSSVTSIGDSAFSGCSGLTSVTIPDSVTSIGPCAFYDCSGLASVTIGAGVTSIGDSAFSCCRGLTSVHITDLAKWCGCSFGLAYANPFHYAQDLYLNGEKVTDLVIPDSVTSIGGWFSGCSGLTSVTIPDSVTSIGAGAFCDCSGLTSVKIPDSVTNIEDSAFYGCRGLTSVTIPDSVTSIGAGAFTDCSELLFDTTTIPGVKLVDGWAIGSTGLLSGNLNLTGVRSIGSSAFYGCRGLTSVTIGDCVTSIGDSAFYGCSGLTSVTIGDGVTRIGEYAFGGCCSLTSVHITDLAKWCGTKWGGILFDSSPLHSAHNLYLNGEKVTDLVIPDSVTSIGDAAFKYCNGLTSVTIPDSVTNIGDAAFVCCSELTSVTIGSSVTNIGDSAFRGCSGLTSVTIGDGVTRIGEYAFGGCGSLTSVTIPDSVTSIGAGAFCDCSGLTSVTIGDGVTSIGGYYFEDGAFDYFHAFNEVYLPERFRDSSMNPFPWLSESSLFYYNEFTVIVCDCLTAADGEGTSIDLVATNACRVAFEWKCSCEPLRKGKMRDFLSFSVDGVQLDAICGETYWTNREFFVEGAGEHILRWTYQKDDSGTDGEDCGWIRLATVVPRVTLSFLSGGATAGVPPEAMSFYADAGQVELPSRGALAWPKHTFLGWSDGEIIWPEGAMYPCDASVLELTAAWARNELAAPVIDAPSEFYEGSTEIAIAAETGTTIYYTLDNSAPTVESLLYFGPITIDATTTIRAIAVKDDCFDSPEAVVTVTKESITAGEAVNAAELEFTTDAESGWRCVKGESPDGYALRSGVIGHNATSRVETVVLGPGQITFSCKVAGEVVKGEVYDGMAFLIDGIQRGELMGNTEWTTNTFEVVGEGEHVLSWLYIKDESDEEVMPDDCAWLDEVKWTSNGGSVEPGLTMATVVFDANGGEMNAVESLRQVETNAVVGELPVPCRSDHAFLGWFTAADGGEEVSAEVVVTSDMTFYAHWQCRFSFDEGSGWTQQTDGSWKSNPTADGVTNSLSMMVSGSGTIAFRWKTSCEGYFNFKGMLIRQDGISLIVDGEERTFTNGVMSAWTECSLAVEGDGNHDLVWAYIKDSSGFEGADCAWLDSVVWTPEGYADPLPEVASDSEVADVLASAVDEARLRAHIFDKVQYDRFRAWVDGNGLDHQVVKDSDRAWFSYAIDANGLVDREFKDGDVTIRSLETSSLGVFTFEVDVKDVQLGAAAMAENLATVFGIQGAVALEESAFSSRNVIVTLGVSSDGRLVVTATPKQASNAFFIRVRMHTDADAADDDGDAEHAMVQLWEGGPYWATTNIGAEKPEDYGYYFWWGDTVGYKWENDEWVATDGSSSNFSFSSSNTPTYAKSIATLNSEGWISADSVLVPAHDAAHVHWGGDWRMPTDAEISSLVANCTTKWITTNGVLGRLVTGKGAYADRSIFLPAAGYGRETSLDWAGSEGAYWFSTPSSDYYDCAWGLDFKSGYFIIGDGIGRPFGFSIRPVQGFTE